MVHVIASIQVKPGQLVPYLDAVKENVATVRAEAGCIEYSATVDADTDLAPQRRDPDRVTMIEKWSTLDALRAHLAAPHMAVCREKVKAMVAGVTLNVLRDA